MRAHRPDQRGHAERRRLRGLPEDRLPVGPPAPVPDVREGRLLQRLPEPALAAPLPRLRPPDDPVLRARRGLDVVLPGRALLRARRRVEAAPASSSSAPRYGGASSSRIATGVSPPTEPVWFCF